MLNERLSFKMCMHALNEMSKHVIDWDSDCDGVIYIIVDPCMIGYLGMLFTNEEELEKYLYDYGENWKEEGFDITGIWGEIDRVFKKDIWWSKKKGFYVRKWHHKVIYAIRTKLRDYKSKYKNFMSKQRRKAYYRKRDKEQNRHIKQLVR